MTTGPLARRLRSLWERGAHALDAIPTSVVAIGLGTLLLTVSDRLPLRLAIPARVLQSSLANWRLLPKPSGAHNAFAGIVAFLTLLTPLGAFACFIVVAKTTLPEQLKRAARWLAIPVLLWSLLASAQTVGILGRGLVTSVTQWPPHYISDEMYYNQFNARLLLAGVNPYTDADDHLYEAMTYFHIRGYTPVARGRFSDPHHTPTAVETRAVAQEYLNHPRNPPAELDPRTLHSYPAGAFLVNVPSVWAGLPGMGLAQILLFIALSIVLIASAQPGTRLLVGMVVWSNPILAHGVVAADFDIWWLTAFIAAWMLGAHRWSSAALVGVACAIKQTVWLAAPFHFIWVCHEYGFAEALRRAGIGVASFLIINLPWLVLSPRDWLSSVLLPMSLPLLPGGSGIIAIALNGAMPLKSSQVYTLLEISVWLGALVWRLFARAQAPFSGLVVFLFPLLVAWRSPERYFLALSVLALAALALTWRQMSRSDPPSPDAARALT